jgi:hypothetical protein
MLENPEIKSSNELPEKKKENSAQEKIENSLALAGQKEKLEAAVIDRLVLLEEESKFNEDSRMIEKGMMNIVNFLEKEYVQQYPQLQLTAEQKKDLRVAALLHDIGKTGPVGATPDQQKAIVRIFSQECVIGENRLLKEVVEEKFSAEEAGEILCHLSNCSVSPQMTIRHFWNQHSKWTSDILEKYAGGMNENILDIAASHHLDRKINPRQLPPEKNSLQARTMGALEDYADVLQGRLLIVVDKYEAAVRRGKVDHKTALNSIRERLAEFPEDEMMSLILDTVDKLGQEGKLFA